MASRTLNRRELRRQAEQPETVAPDTAPAAVPPKTKAPKVSARKKKPRAKKASPRLRARWGVFDATMKQVAVFDYNQRAAADAKLAELLAKKKGLHFLQIVKEPMPIEAPPPTCEPTLAAGESP
jgi:hypothetical protein